MNTVRHHVAFCPHCGNRSPQRIVYEHTYRDRWFGEDGKPLPDDEGPDSEAILCVCQTCNSVLLYDGVSFEESGNWPRLAYPAVGKLPDSVPHVVRDIYREAVAVKRNAPTAFALLIRKALEALCKDLGAPDGTLQSRLRHLVTIGLLPPPLAELTDVLRTVGNAAAHDANQPVTTPMTWAIDEFFRVIVEYVYVAPAKLSEFNAALAKLRDTQ